MESIRVTFAYNEPNFGTIEITSPDLMKELDFESELSFPEQSEEFTQNIMDKIIDMYPEAVDVELTSLEYFE